MRFRAHLRDNFAPNGRDYFTVEFSDGGAVILRASGYHVRAGEVRRQLREEFEMLAGELRAALKDS
jgi:hypothetical protein